MSPKHVPRHAQKIKSMLSMMLLEVRMQFHGSKGGWLTWQYFYTDLLAVGFLKVLESG